MSRNNMGIALIVVGVIVLIVSLAADVIGIGGAPGIGWKQLLGAGVGLIVAIAGGWSLRSAKSK
jgi:hypothetical protein